MKGPTTIHLKDYKKPSFRVDHIDLSVDLFEDKAIVSSVMKIVHEDLNEHRLELLGEGLKLLSLKIDEVELTSSQFQVSEDRLIIFDLEKTNLTVEIKNEIYPHLNKALEGLYKSGEIFCTQCEAEGFRKITYYIDRPDVMGKFSTTITADKRKYPYLLSNGNLILKKDLPDGRHLMKWEDPFRKPSYLFALVAGDFDIAHDEFVTKSGRKVKLEIYVDKGNLKKTPHAMRSLKESMKWDEETYDLEYDLDIYMIVAVDSFNMGAMENKGLNIFNSVYVLADETSATDDDFQHIQGVIGHEYFHNWTGNRVTCRDWFQLTLKEGLTVYRDQEFSSDMLSRPVKRLDDVRRLKDGQFPEDAGPMSHPIRPSSYIEINNFYTATVYEKGAEVIRMIETLIGKQNFAKGLKKYLTMFDGQAVTTEDFVKAMELTSGKDLTQFKNWYSRPGTPKLKVEIEYLEKKGECKIHFEQIYPSPNHHQVGENNVLVIPLKMALYDKSGKTLLSEQLLELKSLKETFEFQLPARPIPSLNRTFSAPIQIDYKYTPSELVTLMGHDSDPYARYEATQNYLRILTRDWMLERQKDKRMATELPIDFLKAYGLILKDETLEDAFKAYLLSMPTLAQLHQELDEVDFEGLEQVRKKIKKQLSVHYASLFKDLFEERRSYAPKDLSAKAMGARSLKHLCLSYLAANGDKYSSLVEEEYYQAVTMTDEISALKLILEYGKNQKEKALKHFEQKWQKDDLVIQKWFALQAQLAPAQDAADVIEHLEKHRLFKPDIPNHLRSVYGRFAMGNLLAFHQQNGKGYELLVDRIQKVDRSNPQIASRLTTAFAGINKMDEQRRNLMKQELKRLMENKPSRDTYEIVSRYMSQ